MVDSERRTSRTKPEDNSPKARLVYQTRLKREPVVLSRAVSINHAQITTRSQRSSTEERRRHKNMIDVRLRTMRIGAARLFQNEFASVSSSMTFGRNSAPTMASQANKDAKAPVARRLATMAVGGRAAEDRTGVPAVEQRVPDRRQRKAQMPNNIKPGRGFKSGAGPSRGREHAWKCAEMRHNNDCREEIAHGQRQKSA